MTQNINFNDLRQKTYLAYHKDGLIDALVGLGILGFGLNMATESSAFMVLSWIPFILYAPLKKLITVPRLGYVKFDSERTKSVKLTMTMLVGVLTLAMFVGLFVFVRSDSMSADVSALFGKYHLLLLGSFVAIAFIIGAALSGIKRFYAQAGLGLLVLISGIELGIEEPVFVMIWGGLTFLIGAWLLVQFLRQYPVIKGDENDVA